MVSAAHDQGDPPADAHAGDLPPVGQVQFYFQFIGRPEHHAAFHGACGNAGLPGQGAPVRHERAQPELRQHFPDEMLILRQVNDGAQPLRVHIFIEQRVLHAFRYEVKEDLLQLPRIDSPPVSRESDLHAEHHIPALWIDPAGRPLQHFLPAAAHRDKSALPGSFRLKCELLRPSAELPCQFILQGDALVILPVQFLRKSGCAPAHPNAHFRRGRKGIPLHMVNG